MASLSKSLSKYGKNSKWIDEHYDELKQKYDGFFVAAYNGKVVDSDKDVTKLGRRIREKFRNVYTEIAVEYISKKEVDIIV